MLVQCPENSTAFDSDAIFRRILVPLDFGPESRHALITACEMRRRFGSEIRLFVVRETARDSVFSFGVTDPWTREDMDRVTRDRLYRLAKEVCDGDPCMKFEAMHGSDVVGAIAKAVRNFQATVVLLPCSGRRTLLRSRAEKIARALDVPVIVLKDLTGVVQYAEQEEKVSPSEKPVFLSPRGRLIANRRWPALTCPRH